MSGARRDFPFPFVSFLSPLPPIQCPARLGRWPLPRRVSRLSAAEAVVCHARSRRRCIGCGPSAHDGAKAHEDGNPACTTLVPRTRAEETRQETVRRAGAHQRSPPKWCMVTPEHAELEFPRSFHRKVNMRLLQVWAEPEKP